jgi:predicted KAP-like P-loop ATPase
MNQNNTHITSSFLSDNETSIDLLSNEAIAITIIGLLLDHPDRPVTIGVHGDWGAGKSSLLEMIETDLAKEKDVLCLKFNGWRFQGFEDAKIALLEGIVTGLLEKRPALTKATEKVKSVFKRIDWLKVARSAGGLAITAFTGIPTFSQVQTLVSTINTIFRNPAIQPSREKIDAFINEAQSLIKPESQSKNVPEEIDEFRKAFDELLREAKIKRLIVLIDDLDRCLPNTAIETLEAIRLFVFTSKTAFVIAADESMIEYAVRRHFPDLPETTRSQTYARNYLEKLIQVPFRIPALGVAETRIYVTLLLIGAVLGEEDPDFINLINAARELMKRPWIGGVIDTSLINTILNSKAEKVQPALFLSDQFGPILASGTNGNPRQIKRFLNTMMLRKRIADARGYGDEVVLPVLAKLMLAERFIPRLFEQIAFRAIPSQNGICDELKMLETEALSQSSVTLSKDQKETEDSSAKDIEKLPMQPDDEKEIKNTLFEQWIVDQKIVEWAKIQPSLAGIDLRPYFFVTKDRKDYFGIPTVLGYLASIADNLFGQKIVLQGKESDLKKLTPQEAAQVFDVVRSRMVSSGAFETEPDGVAGLNVLVKAHPTLQPIYLDFLEGLPTDKLGVWVVRGWGGVFTQPENIQRFNRLIQRWAIVENNSVLKSAAEGAVSIMQSSKRGK